MQWLMEVILRIEPILHRSSAQSLDVIDCILPVHYTALVVPPMLFQEYCSHIRVLYINTDDSSLAVLRLFLASEVDEQL
jgi:hypothetical protein